MILIIEANLSIIEALGADAFANLE